MSKILIIVVTLFSIGSYSYACSFEKDVRLECACNYGYNGPKLCINPFDDIETRERYKAINRRVGEIAIENSLSSSNVNDWKDAGMDVEATVKLFTNDDVYSSFFENRTPLDYLLDY